MKFINRIKWHLKEIAKIYSHETSFYSKKRIESGIAFLIAQWGLVHWMVLNVAKISASDVAIWAGLEFAIAGYTISQIQKEKKSDAATV